MRDSRKLTNMIWTSMAESTLLCLFLFGGFLYIADYYHFLHPFDSWQEVLKLSLTMAVATIVIGTLFGAWQSIRLTRRLDKLYEAMLLLEKGNLSKPVPALGEDEIGRLAEMLGRISHKWGDQVSSLQRLSTNNAQLAEKARYSAVVEERQRLARDLHDAVSQQLFAISMTATAVSRTLDRDYEKAKRQVVLIEEMATVAQSEMRALLMHLRPVHLEGKRLAQGLQELLMELRAKVPVNIQFDMDEEIRLSKGIEDHLFRIVQEALSNTLRHSRATEVELRLTNRSGTVGLTVRDNGSGFDLTARKHASYGLVSMKERVNEIGGSMNIITAPGKGTRIDIRVPLISGEEVQGNVKDGTH